MKNKYLRSFLNSAISILPIIAIVFILSFTDLAPVGPSIKAPYSNSNNYVMLAIGGVIMVTGLSFFQIGAQTSLIKVGEYMGSSLSKQRKLWIVITFAFLLGALITCAEPSILIISKQVAIDKWVLIGSIAFGVDIFVVIGILRIVFHKSLNVWFLAFYLLVFMFICILQADPKNLPYLPFIFDAGGVTTGSATVPFILALGAGVAMTRGGDKSRDSSFGLVGLASIGPILTMVILILAKPSGFNPYVVPSSSDPSTPLTVNLMGMLRATLPSADFSSLGSMLEVFMALAPILVIFFVYEVIFIKLSFKKILGLLTGFIVSFIGLTLFLTAVGSAMSPVGLELGKQLGNQSDAVIIFIAFVIGCVTILCEPAVHVLTTQIEDISDGQLKKRTVLFTLSIGVGVAICLSVVRTLIGFSIIYIIVPGYLISLMLMFVVPDLYTAIAFDSGGTASGPMAVSFVLPMIIGVYYTRNNNLESSVSYYQDAFGVVALVALTPILAIQVLGLVNKIQSIHALHVVRDQIHDERNNEIIHFC